MNFLRKNLFICILYAGLIFSIIMFVITGIKEEKEELTQKEQYDHLYDQMVGENDSSLLSIMKEVRDLLEQEANEREAQ